MLGEGSVEDVGVGAGGEVGVASSGVGLMTMMSGFKTWNNLLTWLSH